MNTYMQTVIQAFPIAIGLVALISAVLELYTLSEEKKLFITFGIIIPASLVFKEYLAQIGWWSMLALLLVPVALLIIYKNKDFIERRKWDAENKPYFDEISNLELLTEEELAKQGKSKDEILHIRAYLQAKEQYRGK